MKVGEIIKHFEEDLVLHNGWIEMMKDLSVPPNVIMPSIEKLQEHADALGSVLLILRKIQDEENDTQNLMKVVEKWRKKAKESAEEANRIYRTVKGHTDAEERCKERAKTLEICADVLYEILIEQNRK